MNNNNNNRMLSDTAGNNGILSDTEKLFWDHLFVFCTFPLLLETGVSFQVLSYSLSYCFLWRMFSIGISCYRSLFFLVR